MRMKTYLPRIGPRIVVHIMIQMKKMTRSYSGNPKGMEHVMIPKKKMIGTCSRRNTAEVEATSSLSNDAHGGKVFLSSDAHGGTWRRQRLRCRWWNFHRGEVPYVRGSCWVVWVCTKKESKKIVKRKKWGRWDRTNFLGGELSFSRWLILFLMAINNNCHCVISYYWLICIGRKSFSWWRKLLTKTIWSLNNCR